MKTRLATTLLSLATAAMLAQPAAAQIKIHESESTKLFIHLHTVGTAQTLDQKNVFDATGKNLGNLTNGLQTAFGDLGFVGKFGKNEEIEMYFDLYLSSRNHPSQTYGNQGYLVMHGVPENLRPIRPLQKLFEHVDVKVGAFLIDFGDHILHRTNNAIAQNNPLVGNYVIDPELVSVGGEIMSKPGRFNWLVGVTNGTNTEDFTKGRGLAYNAKVWAYPIKPLRLAASGIRVDHADAASSRAALFAGNRGGERYGAVLGGGQAPGQVLPQAGRNLTAFQLDATFDPENPLLLYANFGDTRDEDTNSAAAGTPEEHWRYYAAEARWHFTPTIYAAARYSGADALKIADRDSDGTVNRIQLGGGLWLTRNMLAKLEYVQQQYDSFATGVLLNNNIQAWRNPEFSGFVAEVSFSF